MHRFASRVLKGLSAGVLGLAVSASAATFYVDPINGDDNDLGNQPNQVPGTNGPVKTITRAGQKVAATPEKNDIVYLIASGTAAGHYLDPTRLARDCAFTSSFAGISGSVLTVETYPADVTAGRFATFDPGYSEFKSNPNTAWVHAQTGGSGIPADPTAHADEYVSVNTYDMVGNDGAFGCFLKTDGTSGDRLLTYARIEDLRAANQSFAKVPLSDPRPSGGPLIDDPETPEDESQTKFPWAYRGPGIHWDKRGDAVSNPYFHRIHFRASATTFNQPGVTDYTGGTNPLNMSLSIALSGHYAFTNVADYITFKNIIIQNGGESSGRSVGSSGSDYSLNTTFDHCNFYMARNGFSTNWSKFLTFNHCVFDGRLGSYVSRTDVKTDYTFTNGLGQQETNGSCRMTAACLLLASNNNEDMDIANCEFRNGHDGVQLWGIRSKLHHSLLENLNDEAIMVYGAKVADTTQVYNNVIRKVMQAFSSSEGGNGTLTGARYIYRNIVDMRVPIMGTHEIAPDPINIWRAGEDFKFNMPVPEIYCYQNTFVMPPIADASGNECADVWGNISNAQYPTPKPRQYKNNVYMAIHTDRPLHTVPNPSFTQLVSDGNVWSRRVSNPAQHLFNSYNSVKYTTWTAMHAVFPIWEAAGQNLIAYPQFNNVGDYVPSHGGSYLNADFRLKSTSPGRYNGAGTGGVSLAATGWPGTAGSSSNPDCGAIPYGTGTAFTVGVDNRFAFPDSVTPIAEAGDYSVYADSDNDGFHTVALSSTGTSDPDGTISNYNWYENGSTFSTSASPSIGLPVGTHRLFLTVTDNSGKTATDMREVTITGNENIAYNPGLELGSTKWQLNAGTSIVNTQHHLGSQCLQLAASTTERSAWQLVPIIPGVPTRIAGWAKTSGVASGKYCRMKYDWLDSTGAVISGSNVGVVNNANWTLLTVAPITPPAGAVTCRVKPSLDAGSGTAWVDDICVLVDNVLKNPYFASGLTNWQITGGTGSITTNATNVRSGVQALEIGPQSSAFSMRQIVLVTGGNSYNFSAMVKTQSMLGAVTFRVQWFSNPNGQSGLLGTNNIATTPAGTAGYIQLTSAAKTAPAGAQSASVQILTTANETGTCWVDDLYMK